MESTNKNPKRELLATSVLGILILVHAGALLGFYTGFSWAAFTVFFGLYVVRGMGVSTGYHRYFAHRSFQTGRVMQFLLGLCGSMALQGAVLWWVSHHREHHRYTETEDDIHSPVIHGFWKSHMGWMFDPKAFDAPKIRANDFAKYPEIKFLQRNYLWIQVFQIAGLFALGLFLESFYPQLETSGLQLVVWGFFMNTVLLWHSTFAVNSVCHLWGQESYDARDTSKNNALVALFTFGEGWHNNHHKFGSSARHGLDWWQIDVTYIFLRALEKVGLVRNLKLPSVKELAEEKKTSGIQVPLQM